MSNPRIPEPARVVISVLALRGDTVGPAQSQLVEQLGPVEEEVGPLPFEFTSYYDEELGAGINRWLWVFADLVEGSDLVRLKCLTNDLERAFARRGRRTFNLDPGLMTLGNFVLATGKNNAHRIYLGKGIFADLTLVYRGGSYIPLEWTYPDYADPELIGILNTLRETYKWKLRRKGLLTGA